MPRGGALAAFQRTGGGRRSLKGGRGAARLRRVDEAVSRRRLFAAGFVSYEASPGLDHALKVRSSPDMPLVWLGLYENAEQVAMPMDFARPLRQLDWTPTVTRGEYEDAIHEIKTRIAAGSTYQVNYTYRLRAPFSGDPWAYFTGLAGGGRAGYAAFVDTGRWAVCSASPELFFRVRDGHARVAAHEGHRPAGQDGAGRRGTRAVAAGL